MFVDVELIFSVVELVFGVVKLMFNVDEYRIYRECEQGEQFCQLLINILRGEREIPPKSRAGKPLFERDGCMVHNLTAMAS